MPERGVLALPSGCVIGGVMFAVPTLQCRAESVWFFRRPSLCWLLHGAEKDFFELWGFLTLPCSPLCWIAQMYFNRLPPVHAMQDVSSALVPLLYFCQVRMFVVFRVIAPGSCTAGLFVPLRLP